MKRRAFMQSALITAAWTAYGTAAAGQPDRHSGNWIIPTNKPDRFGLKVMAFNPIRKPDLAAYQLSIAGLNRAIADVAGRARANKFRLDDLQGSTFTIDNTGWFGSNLTMPIINVPEVAILTMEAITKRPVVRETAEGDVIAIRPVMNMVMAIDHRANDGAQAAAFLNEIKRWLESVDADIPLW